MRRIITSLVLLLPVTGCSSEIDLEPTPGDEVPEVSSGGEDILSDYALEDGYLVAPELEAPEGATRVGMMLNLLAQESQESQESDVEIAVEARGIDKDGFAGEWLPMEITWKEGRAMVLRADVSEEMVFAAQIRLPATAAPLIERITWSAVVPVPEEAYNDDSGEQFGATQQALSTSLKNFGVKSRSAWGARATRCSSLNTSKYRMAIHHTVTPHTQGGSYTAILRQMQSYHMDSHGWCDIGYHFLMTYNGTAWEGRPLKYLGTHVANHNTGNIGISYVGCFDKACSSSTYGSGTPSSASIEKGGKLVGLLAKTYGIRVSTTTVKGHRDHSGNSTSCPGSRLYARLGDIRSIAKGGTSVSSTGFTRFFNPNTSGAGSLIEEYTFKKGWTNITNVDLDGDGEDELMYYRASDGFTRFMSPNNKGAGAPIADYNFKKGWTNITNVDLDGDGKDELMYYRASDGFTRFMSPNNKGAGAPIADHWFKKGWTNITNVDLDGDGEDELMYYRASDGFTRFMHPNNMGSGTPIADYTFRKGWTSITSVDLNGDGEDDLMYYRAGDGFTRFMSPNNKGAGASIADYNFRKDWSNITNVDLDGDGKDELMYYN